MLRRAARGKTMIRRSPLAALMLALALPAVAAAPGLPAALAGVYKHRFANADVQGDHYTSEDILEIVPVDGDAAYVRLHLDFYNGHICDISGVARQAGESLVYDGPADTDGKPCRLTLASRGDGVHIFEDENGSCRNQTCGARGGYGFKADGPPDFTPAQRRTIRYLPRLEASAEYKAALDEYRARPAKR
jgi:hypothetical protein